MRCNYVFDSTAFFPKIETEEIICFWVISSEIKLVLKSIITGDYH